MRNSWFMFLQVPFDKQFSVADLQLFSHLFTEAAALLFNYKKFIF